MNLEAYANIERLKPLAENTKIPRFGGQRIMTNGEWLRAQDDETLADFITLVLSVTDGIDDTVLVKDMIVMWLQAEHDEDYIRGEDKSELLEE